MGMVSADRLAFGDSRLRLQTAVRLRWFGVLGQLATVAFVFFGLNFDLAFGLCVFMIALSAWLNVYLRIRYPARHRLSTGFATGLLAYDIAQLALLLFLTGGVDNPFTFLLVVPVTVSAATLPPRNTIILGAFAAVSAVVLASYHLPLPWHLGSSFELPMIYRWGVLASVGAGMAFLALYTWRLSNESTQMSAALAATEAILAREQQLHAIDGLAAAAAHELGTPLSTITLVAKELGRDVAKDSPMAEDLALLQSQAQRCREILQKLTRSPAERDPLHATLSVTQLIQEAAEPHLNIKARVAMSSDAEAGIVEAGRIEPFGDRRPGVIYGIGNLIENAVEFAREHVQVSARWSLREVVITIADDGPGFPIDLMDSLGEPYVTTRPARSGVGSAGAYGKATGLGLGFFIAKTLLERSGADVTLENRIRPESGAIVRVRWSREAFEASAGGIGEWPGRRGGMPRSPTA
jgi:two-component system, sensor histidine kinase RegB